MKQKILISLVLVLALMAGVGYGFAAAGGKDDPLITKSFVDGDYYETVIAEGYTKIDSSLTGAFNDATAGLGGGDTGSFGEKQMMPGGVVRLDFGGSIVITSGGGKLNIKSGEVINVSIGASVKSGAMTVGDRYLAAEGTSATVEFTAQSSILIDGDVTVVSGEGSDCPFTDVKASDWFYADVLSAYEMGLVNGMTLTTFVPEGNMSYAQVIKLAACTHQIYHEGAVTLGNGSPLWYQTYVDYAMKQGIITQAPADYDAAVPRNYYIAVMYRAMPESEYAKINNVADNAIPDVKSGDAFAKEIYGFYRAGIAIGSDLQYNFNPNMSVKRNEVATLVARMFDDSVRKTITLP